MNISYQWLTDFIDWTETDPQIIADRLTAASGEIDDITVQGAPLERCVVGIIISIDKHPSADKLSLCDVETDKGIKRVVCGGTNLKPSQLVAFAHIGATVKWHGGETMVLAPVKIRGEASEGMICAAEELELEAMFQPKAEDGPRPIIDLTPLKPTVGTPLKEALGLTDIIFHIDNHAITNRPDLFSHIGVARECVALRLARWKKRLAAKKQIFPKTALPFACINDVPELIPSYESCLLNIENVGRTPPWMKRRLEATGWRSINLPIDITNYVMMETGMPLHSFDSDDFKGDIHMRTSKKGEKLTTLDGIERELSDGAVVISDDDGIFDLLGIMGGLRSSTKNTSTHLYLHSAQVDSTAIRKAIIATGHRTDAATVYEKGVAAVTVKTGFIRALELMLELVPGATIVSKRESWGVEPKAKSITLSLDRLQSMIGQEIPEKTVIDILTNLEFEVKKRKFQIPSSKPQHSRLMTHGSRLSITPPSFRLADIAGEHDIVEEVARIFGYGNIMPTMPVERVQTPEIDDRIHVLRHALKEHAYTEQLHLAFTNEDSLKRCGFNSALSVRIENPLGEEMALMRPSLLPSLLKTIGREVHRTGQMLKHFEYGNVFTKEVEFMQVCLVVSVKNQPLLKEEPLLILKSDARFALSALERPPTFRQKTDSLPAFAHPGRSADIMINGTVVGLLCEIHPSLESANGLSNRTAVAIFDWEKLLSTPPQPTLFHPLPAFPAITYDETLPLPFKNGYSDVIAKSGVSDPLLIDIATVDIYDGDGDKRITLRFTYRSTERTLTQAEADTAHGKVMATLQSQLR